MLYQSDITQFLNKLKKDNPSIEKKQQEGHSILWDKTPISLREQKNIAQSTIPHTPYVYYQNS